jgi:hypothetical protein
MRKDVVAGDIVDAWLGGPRKGNPPEQVRARLPSPVRKPIKPEVSVSALAMPKISRAIFRATHAGVTAGLRMTVFRLQGHAP